MFDPVSHSVCHILGYRVCVISSLKYFAVFLANVIFRWINCAVSLKVV